MFSVRLLKYGRSDTANKNILCCQTFFSGEWNTCTVAQKTGKKNTNLYSGVSFCFQFFTWILFSD